jgi:hypothetical protein
VKEFVQFGEPLVSQVTANVLRRPPDRQPDERTRQRVEPAADLLVDQVADTGDGDTVIGLAVLVAVAVAAGLTGGILKAHSGRETVPVPRWAIAGY